MHKFVLSLGTEVSEEVGGSVSIFFGVHRCRPPGKRCRTIVAFDWWSSAEHWRCESCSSFLVVGIRDAESDPLGSEFSEGGHLCSDAGFRHRWSRADCAVKKTATQRQITMTQKLWEEINFFRIQCSTGLVVWAVQVPQETTPRKLAQCLSTLHRFAARRSCDSGELKREHVRALIEKGTWKAVRERKVKLAWASSTS